MPQVASNASVLRKRAAAPAAKATIGVESSIPVLPTSTSPSAGSRAGIAVRPPTGADAVRLPIPDGTGPFVPGRAGTVVDFDVAKGKNSGVGLRGSSCGDPAFTGMEIQVFGNQGEKPTITSCGSVYDAIAPTGMPLKDGGQWNTFRIKLVGDTLNMWMNGEQIHKDQKLDSRGIS